MKYYKLINDNTLIGVIHSGAFVKESANGARLFYSDEVRGEFVDYNGLLYRDYWMVPTQSSRNYTLINIIEITKEEYDTIKTAIDNNETIIIDDDDDEPYVEPEPVEDPDITVEYVRESKLREMSITCRQIIEAGFDLELRGENHHFSLDTQDQLNLISLSAMAQTQQLIPYHADGEQCIFYTNEEMNEIVETATAFKIYHTTYYNALKGYINSLETIQDIAAIQYGVEIPEEFKSDVLKALEV